MRPRRHESRGRRNARGRGGSGVPVVTNRPAGRHLAGSLVLATLAGACTASPRAHLDETLLVPSPEREVVARLEAGFRVNGLVPQGVATNPPGPIEAIGASSAASGWADCPTLRLTDPSSRMNRSAAVTAGEIATRVVANVQAVSPASTRVVLRATHGGSYLNPFTNTAQGAACPSTGALERSLLGALAAGA